MDARELRIGNFVKLNEKEFTIIHEILEVGMTCKTKSLGQKDYYEIEDLTPIPLTEEWLLKFGFDLNSDHFIGEVWGIEGNNYYFCISCKSYTFVHSSFNTRIEYVHQLQNLYHALTGKELEIND